jgi:hypothetical protein
MTVSTFLKLVAIWLGLNGAISILIPQVAAAGLGQTLNAFDLFAAQTVGVLLLTLAIMNWVLSVANAASVRGALWGNLFMNIALASIDSLNLLTGTIAVGSLFGIGIHVLVIVGLVYYLVRWKPTTQILPRV